MGDTATETGGATSNATALWAGRLRSSRQHTASQQPSQQPRTQSQQLNPAAPHSSHTAAAQQAQPTIRSISCCLRISLSELLLTTPCWMPTLRFRFTHHRPTQTINTHTQTDTITHYRSLHTRQPHMLELAG